MLLWTRRERPNPLSLHRPLSFSLYFYLSRFRLPNPETAKQIITVVCQKPNLRFAQSETYCESQSVYIALYLQIYRFVFIYLFWWWWWWLLLWWCMCVCCFTSVCVRVCVGRNGRSTHKTCLLFVVCVCVCICGDTILGLWLWIVVNGFNADREKRGMDVNLVLWCGGANMHRVRWVRGLLCWWS